MNILVLGSGGREHALAAALADSDQIENLFIAPGNAGTQALATNVDLDILASSDVLAFCQQHDIDVVVVGPEAPLVAGVADDLRAAHIAVFGPGKDAAQLEGSKSFSKAFMQRHNLPTAAYEVCRTREQAQNYLSMHGAPVVVKADGLAAGKGVVVAYDEQTAQNAIDDCFSGRFGQAGDVVVLEELLAGPECSMIAFVADGNAVCLPPSQDHKRAFDGDRGPNTGGMGAYSPVPAVTNSQLQQMQDIMSVA
ncbi:MAG: phosphoribosylamine--glycine ligase, partial [Eggerthellaceae bacterium]|nr:phosphoribosylamine--glycine ligase [Eggerthellaceae bacterium]